MSTSGADRDPRYPPIEPDQSGLLNVGDGHQVYWEACGNPAGRPALYLHGGPGSGASAGQRRFFDPAAYRIVLFDQRGCGRSRPLASDTIDALQANRTAHLIRDIEALRVLHGVDRWTILGLSWGATLAQAYAQAHPDRVDALVLGLVTTTSRAEVAWITHDMRRVFPREWAAFAAVVPPRLRDVPLVDAYADLLANPDPAIAAEAARAWCAWEDAHISLMPGFQPSPRYADPRFRLGFARLVTHYWRNFAWLGDDGLLRDAPRIAHIPAALIHGRHDISGPLITAWELHRQWPLSTLAVLDEAGHGGAGLVEAVVAALDRFRGR